MLNSLDDIELLVEEYKESTSQVALGKLIDAFSAYLTKWVNVLKWYHVNTGDSEIATFVGLFRCSSMIDLRNLLDSTFKSCDDEELYNELVLLFIYTILQYRNNGTTYFPGYLKSSFKYRVYRWTISKLSEMPHSISIDSIDEDDIPRTSNNGSIDYDILLDPEVLPCITSKEKMVLYLRYVDGRTTDDIAKIYGCTSKNINNIISKARKKLSEDILRRGSQDK